MPLKKKKLVLKKKRKRGQRAGLTRDKIRDASLKVWMEKPAEDFSLNDVARALDVFPVTIRSHYKGGRGEILDEIARDILIGIAPPFTSKNDPKAYLSAVFSEAATIARKSPSLLRELAFRLADRPLLSPQFAERICAILADLAPEADAAWGLKLVINRLSGLILTEAGRWASTPQVDVVKEVGTILADLPNGEFKTLAKLQSSIGGVFSKNEKKGYVDQLGATACEEIIAELKLTSK